jgi:tetratricopeptide (TPR) repeat protein/tRNA A-37 threonylcarbamoyl transferase component Bud32
LNVDDDNETRDDDGLASTRTLADAEGAARLQSELPERIDRFEIIELVGAGGMGVVYRARDPRLDRDVALKLVRADLRHVDSARLRREARALAALSHPHVVQVFEVGEDRGRLYLAMEYVPGRNLRQWLASRPVAAQVVARLLEAAHGLAAAHDAGLLHRDIKPSNIYVGDDGRARLLDFGLARGLGETTEGRLVLSAGLAFASDPSTDLATPLTETGTMLGTPIYMAPEQLRGHPATAASDQFGLCVTAYEALLGVHPFRGRPAVPLGDELQVEPPAASAQLDPRVARLRPLLLRGMSCVPERRWPSMHALVHALEQAVVEPPSRGPRWALAGVAAVAGVAVAAAAWGPEQAEVPVPTVCAQGSSLAEVWSAARRAALRSSILGTSLGHASDTWGRVETQLDAHARAWEAAHAEACALAMQPEAEPTAPLEARLACLERDREAVVAVLDLLAEPDPQLLQHAIALTQGLESPARCNEPAHLVHQPARPTDPATLAAVTELEPRQAKLRALRHSARYGQALRLVQELDHAREAIDHPPLQVEIDVALGAVLARAERDEEAALWLERGFFQAQALGMDDLAFEAALNLVLVVGAHAGREDEGFSWVRHAEAALEHHEDPGDRALLAVYRGLLLEHAGRIPEAIAELERAVAAIEGAREPRPLALADTLTNLAAVLGSQGRDAEAEVHLRRAVAFKREHLGRNDPSLAPSLASLASAMASQGRKEEALVLYREALAVLDASEGRRQPLTVTLLASMGNTLRALGRFDEALQSLEEASEIGEATLDPGHPGFAQIDNNLALVLQGLGRDDEALVALRRALERRRDAMGPDHPSLLPPMVNLGQALLDLGRTDEAALQLERALEIAGGEVASDMDRAMTLVPAAELARVQGRTGDAVERAELAVSSMERSEAEAVYLSRARFELARALVAAGRERPRALELARRARDDVARGKDEPRGEERDAHAEIDAWLAEQQAMAGAR